MLKLQVAGHRPRPPRHGRVILARVERQQGRVGDIVSLNAIEKMHAFDEMRHWRDPEQRLLTLPRQQRTLIDDNPCRG